MAILRTFTQTSTTGALQRWYVFNDFDTLADDVITRLSHSASEAIAERGVFNIALAGGNTPKALYCEFGEIATDWRSWYVYFGDERCLPRGHEERNDSMARRCWLDHVPIPSEHVFSIPAELGADAAASAYAEQLADVPMFDMVLLGLGEDGHTASLFPGLPQRSAPAFAVHEAPKLPHERVTMSAARLSNTREVWFLVSGEGKRSALRQLYSGANIPAATIKPLNGIDIFTDVD